MEQNRLLLKLCLLALPFTSIYAYASYETITGDQQKQVTVYQPAVGDNFQITDETTGVRISYVVMETGDDNTVKVSAVYNDKMSTILSIPETVSNQGVSFDVVAVGRSVLYYDNTFKTVKLPNSLKTIESVAFCSTNIEEINLPDNLASLGEHALSNNSNLKSFSINLNNPVFSTKDGVLFNKDQTRLRLCPGGRSGNYTVPSTVTAIEESSFAGCLNLKNITLPDNLEIIPYQSFKNCGITTLSIPDKVSNVAWNAINDCPNLESIHIGSGVEFISKDNFTLCPKLQHFAISDDNEFFYSDGKGIMTKDRLTLNFIPASITGDYVIPSTVTTIGQGFIGSSLKSITISKNVTEIADNALIRGKIFIEAESPSAIKLGENAFNKLNATIIVPASSYQRYIEDKSWNEYADNIYDGRHLFGIDTDETLSTRRVVNIPVTMDNAEDIIGFQCDIHLSHMKSYGPKANFVRDEDGNYIIVLSSRAADTHVVTAGVPKDIEISDYDNVIRLVGMSMSNRVIKGNSGVLFSIPVIVDHRNTEYEDIEMIIDNIILSKKGNIMEKVPATNKTFKVRNYIPGDVDDDMEVSVVDVTSAIAYITGLNDDNFNVKAADLDSDGTISIVDVTTLVDMITGNIYASEDKRLLGKVAAKENDPSENLMTCDNIDGDKGSIVDLSVSLDNIDPIIGFQCDIILPEGVTIAKNEYDEFDFKLSVQRITNHMVSSGSPQANTYRVLAFSFTNAQFKGNSGEIFTCPLMLDAPAGEYSIELAKIILSKKGSIRLDLPDYTSQLRIKDDSSVVEVINANDENEDAEWYNMQGIKVNVPSSGVFIKRSGENVTKVLVK